MIDFLTCTARGFTHGVRSRKIPVFTGADILKAGPDLRVGENYAEIVQMCLLLGRL